MILICQLVSLLLALQNMKAIKESDTDSIPEADKEAKEVAESKAEDTSTSQPAAELEEELLQNAPRGSGDKLRVLRTRLKRLGGNIKQNLQVNAKLSLHEIKPSLCKPTCCLSLCVSQAGAPDAVVQ